MGGLGGLYLGYPHNWQQVSKAPVRQVLSVGSDAWVVYGSGAVDKLSPVEDKRFPDVWYGSAQRPWSCVSTVGDTLLSEAKAVGSSGAKRWARTTQRSLTETW